MQRKIFNCLMTAAVLVSSTLVGASVYADDRASHTRGADVADVYVSRRQVEFDRAVAPAAFLLTVSTPSGAVIEEIFDGSETPAFDLSRNYGVPMTDGQYTYELKALPYTRASRTADEASRGATVSSTYTMAQSGSFQAVGGNLVLPDSAGEPVPIDNVIVDDEIVQGSLCVGTDCVNGESFGFDAIRLKENNLRIHFDDTSATSGFPANDWRITVNDTATGGLSYFSIDDATAGTVPFLIEAGAGTNALYIDDNDRIGVGTSTPSVNGIHMAWGDTPALRLDQDGTGGYTAQVWDVAGNEANFFVRNVTSSSALPFRIRPTAPTNTLTLGADGYVGMGTWSPSADLEIERTGTAILFVMDRTDGASAMMESEEDYVSFGSMTIDPVYFVVNDLPVMTLDTNGYLGVGTTTPTHLIETAGGAYCDGNSWVDASSRSLKENIESLSAAEATEALMTMDPVKFNYIADSGDEHVGFIAEDVPELVATEDRRGMSAMDVAAVLTKVVQEQSKAIAQQQAIIAGLEARLEQLEK